MLLVLGLGLLCLAWVGWRSYQAYDHLRTAAGLVSAMQTGVADVTAINPSELDVTLGKLQGEASQAHSAAEDPFVRAASGLPWLGSNFQALRAVSATVDDLSRNALPQLVTSASQINPSTVKLNNGTIDLVPIERAAPGLAQADAVIRAGIDTMTSVHRDGLLASVRAAVDNLQAKLVATSKTTGTAASFSKLLPALLGSQGQRRYLLVFQNNAEIRATGGIFGSYALVDVNEGRISLTSHGSAARTIKNFDQPVDNLGVDQLNLYGKTMALAPQNVNFTPDFPTAAELFAKMFQTRSGIAVDGVIAADPDALSYAMAGKAGIKVGSGVTLNSSNVVQFLLSDIYSKFPGQNQTERDAFLSNATSLAFGSLLSGAGNNVVAVKGLVKAVDQRRLLVWSAHPDVQAALAKTVISGSMAAMSGSEAEPAFGVFLNDSTGTKLSYYLQNQVELSPGSCDPAGRRQWIATVTLTYPAPPNDLPTYVLADRKSDRYQLTTKVMLVPLTSGTVTGAQVDGVPTSLQTGVDHFRPVAVATIKLEPGTQAVLKFAITGGASGLPAGAQLAPQLYTTPGVNPTAVTAVPATAC